MKSICIIGAGNLGSATAFALMLKSTGKRIELVDIDASKEGEVLDLAPVAKDTSNEVVFSASPSNADVYVITAGKARRRGESKEELFETNKRILSGIMENLPKDRRVFIATNPPTMISKAFSAWNCTAFGIDTDRLRANFLDTKVKGTHESLEGEGAEKVRELNSRVMSLKGFTQYTPAYALAKRVLEELDG
ncbi:MAG: hypothetical protein JW834_00260 [Candidatus Diapherotrites archaeon]|nr:hypothetical protein [Candidatus Diapherotrites archaeon]